MTAKELKKKFLILGMYLRDWKGLKSRTGLNREEVSEADDIATEIENGLTSIDCDFGMPETAEGCYQEALRIARKLGIPGVQTA